MLGIFRRWISSRESNGRAQEEHEVFGEVAVRRTLGEAIVSGNPRRVGLRNQARDLLMQFERDEKIILIDRLLIRFAIYVGDLGASEKNHHAEPYGLYEHSLEVAVESVRKLHSARFRVSEDPSHEHHERPLWIYGAFILGLLHDVGKAFDQDVLGPGEKELWNPLVEPLLSFLSRHRLSRTPPELRKYHPKRGLKRHTWLGLLLLQKILPKEAIGLLGPRLPRLLDAYVRSENFDKAECLQGPEGDVVYIVRHFDEVLAKLSEKGDADRKAEVPLQGTSPEKPKATVDEPKKEPAATPTIVRETPIEPAVKVEEPQPLPQPVAPVPSPAEPSLPSPPMERSAAPGPVPSAGKESPPPGLLFGVPPVADPKHAVDLEPLPLLEHLKKAIISANLPRNSPRASVFIGRSRSWLVYPEAFAVLAKYLKIPYTQGLHEYLLKVLASLPQTEPKEVVHARVSPEAKEAVPLLGIFTAGFLTDAELETLGIWKYEIVPSQGRWGPRALSRLAEREAA